jgi:hypothetical protein
VGDNLFDEIVRERKIFRDGPGHDDCNDADTVQVSTNEYDDSMSTSTRVRQANEKHSLGGLYKYK